MDVFANVPKAKVPRSSFNLSHEKKLTTDMGRLTPIFMADCLPGDYFTGNSEVFIRFAPLLAPIMHRINCTVHYFAVPFRILMESGKFEEFITGFDKNGKPSNVVLPLRNAKHSFFPGFLHLSSLADYLGYPCYEVPDNGLPSSALADIDINIMPFLAYQMIWNEYYRDQDLDEAVDLEYWHWHHLNDMDNNTKLLELKHKCWEKDYFTAARPWAQKGDPVPLPGQGGSGGIVVYKNPDNKSQFILPIPPIPSLNHGAHMNVGVANPNDPHKSIGVDYQSSYHQANIDPNGTFVVEGSGSSGIFATVNDLRVAVQVQRYLERAARSGTRYIEWLYSFFGVRSSDARLQRPEYIGGGTQPVVISEVLQTSESTDESPQGNMTGHGISSGSQHRFKYKCEEHCLIMGIMHIIPRTTYQEGLARFWTKSDKYEFGLPMFAHLGEQQLFARELFLKTDEDTDLPQNWNDRTWGYMPRYSEYRFIPSTVHGDFRQSLKMFHCGRIFRPDFNGDVSEYTLDLNEKFVRSFPTTRIFAVQGPGMDNPFEKPIDHLWCSIYNRVHAVRPLPRFSEPGYLDHF